MYRLRFRKSRKLSDRDPENLLHDFRRYEMKKGRDRSGNPRKWRPHFGGGSAFRPKGGGDRPRDFWPHPEGLYPTQPIFGGGTGPEI